MKKGCFMPKKELVDYFHKELKRGVKEERIKEALYSVGHSSHHVEEALNHVNKRRSRTNYFILFISIAIILVVVLISYNVFISHFEKDDVIFNDVVPLSDMNIFSNAVNTNNLKLCDQIVDLVVRNDCLNYEKPQPNPDMTLFSRSVNENNKALCNNINDPVIKNDCLNYETPKPNPDMSLFSRAVNENNPILCNDIFDEIIKNDCKNFFR
jgi:hypothetical protein